MLSCQCSPAAIFASASARSMACLPVSMNSASPVICFDTGLAGSTRISRSKGTGSRSVLNSVRIDTYSSTYPLAFLSSLGHEIVPATRMIRLGLITTGSVPRAAARLRCTSRQASRFITGSSSCQYAWPLTNGVVPVFTDMVNFGPAKDRMFCIAPSVSASAKQKNAARMSVSLAPRPASIGLDPSTGLMHM